MNVYRCQICGRFYSKAKPCKGDHHNMENYYERMESQADDQWYQSIVDKLRSHPKNCDCEGCRCF